MKRWHKLAALAAGVAALAGAGATARVADAAPSAQAPIQVGVVYSRTGLLAAYGAQFVQGLRYGIAYATKGTSAVNGRKIELTLVDDGTDPVKAVAGAKDLIGKGYKIITGTTSSGIALQLAPLADQNKILYISGPAATDAVTGVNKNTFRSGRQSDPGRAHGGLVPRRRRREERHRLRAGLGVRPGQLPRRQPLMAASADRR